MSYNGHFSQILGSKKYFYRFRHVSQCLIDFSAKTPWFSALNLTACTCCKLVRYNLALVRHIVHSSFQIHNCSLPKCMGVCAVLWTVHSTAHAHIHFRAMFPVSTSSQIRKNLKKLLFSKLEFLLEFSKKQIYYMWIYSNLWFKCLVLLCTKTLKT